MRHNYSDECSDDSSVVCPREILQIQLGVSRILCASPRNVAKLIAGFGMSK